MRRMSSTTPLARLGLVVAAALALITTTIPPAQAGGVVVFDGNDVDYDAACVVPNVAAPPPLPNSVPSPGLPGCAGFSTYDASTESTDLRQANLLTNTVDSDGAGPADAQFVASCYLDGPIPLAGSTAPPFTMAPVGTPFDAPDTTFLGVSCKLMFQNPSRQDTRPTNAAGGGAARSLGFPSPTIYDLHGHWRDGYHHFIEFAVQWDGVKWIHSAKIGTYDPAPNGGFIFTELGIDFGAGWMSHDPNALFGINWGVTVATAPLGPTNVTVTVDDVVKTSCLLCAGGVFNTVYAKRGDRILNVKALTSADRMATLPVTVPLSLVPGFSDVTTLGGFIFFSDTTFGGSRNTGLIGTFLKLNITGIAYTPGPTDRAKAGEWLGLFGNGPVPDEVTRYADATKGVGASMPDTLGPSPACWKPTFGGFLPSNPFFNPAIGCHYDDDNVPIPNAGPWAAFNPGERGTFLPEFWDTNFAFTA